ncbi:MAG: response regulator transcription factor [Chloroflexota bacterium]
MIQSQPASGIRVLTIEDDESIQEVIQAYLEASDYKVYSAASGPEGLSLFEQTQPQIVILDLNLPGMDGMELAAKIRKQSDAYILMLTARGEELDRIAGLKIGADDYVVKPFSGRELIARIEMLLRRSRTIQKSTFTTGTNTIETSRLKIDLDSFETTTDGLPIDLTTREFVLLRLFMQHQNQVLSRDQIMHQVWGDGDHRSDRTVDVYVGQLRRKIEKATQARLIATVRGVGYRFRDED